jgi:hypothetical protein
MALKWIKKGLLFSPQQHQTPEWMDQFAQAPCVLVLDDCIRVYFSCRPKPDERGQYVSYSAFVDLDKNDLHHVLRISEHPILPLGELGTFDEFGVYPTSVIADGETTLAYFGGWTRCESVPFNVAIGIARGDARGENFKRLGNGPVLSYSPDEPFILSGPKIRRFNNQWMLFYIAGRRWIMVNDKPEPVYKIRMATSPNGLEWTKHNSDLIPSAINDNEAQASPDVIFSNGHYHMFFCYRHGDNYRGKEKGYRIGYAWSTDLIHWHRNDEHAGITISEAGFDDQMISYPHVFEHNNRVYMFYLGNDVGRMGFGLAELDGTLEIPAN